MRLQSLCYLLLWLIVSTTLTTCAQGISNGLLAAEADVFINQVLKDWNSPGGAAVAVVRGNSKEGWNVETKGYGIATLNGTKVTETTRFAIGSNSKLFDILATGLLINNASLSPPLSWTSKIASVVPNWGLMDPIATKGATIIDLMSHRTGLPRHDVSFKSSDDIPTIVKKMKFWRPSAEFRDVWQYSNAMYILLSYLPPLLVKVPFARYVKEHIFDPLGMNSTTYSYDVAYASGQLADGMTRQPINNSVDNGIIRAYPYWSKIGGEDGNVMSGPGGVITNAVDAATWLQTLLLGGVRPGTNTTVIPASAINKVASGITVSAGVSQFPELSAVVYGGGQTRGTYRGHEIIEHGGDVPGFHSQISRLPYDDLGIAVLTNDDNFGPIFMEIIKYGLLDRAFGLEKIDWTGRYKTILSAPPPPPIKPPVNASLPTFKLTSLTGTYNNNGYGSFELCLVSPKDSAASKTCQALASRAPAIFPGIIDPNVPTFLSEWDAAGASYVSFVHFNGNIFNVSGLNSYPTGDPSEPYWSTSITGSSTGTWAEFTRDGGNIGTGLAGIWGAGDGIPSPQGKTVHERAEVWFDKTS